MIVQVRKVSIEDLELLIKWRMLVLSEVFPPEAGEDRRALIKSSEEYYKKHLADDSHTACFAVDEKNNEIIGCGGICYQSEMPSPDNKTGTCGYLMNIFALPEYRRAGVGRKIVEFLISEARARGTEKIYLESSSAAKSLYKKLGFVDLEDYMKLQS